MEGLLHILGSEKKKSSQFKGQARVHPAVPVTLSFQYPMVFIRQCNCAGKQLGIQGLAAALWPGKVRLGHRWPGAFIPTEVKWLLSWLRASRQEARGDSEV